MYYAAVLLKLYPIFVVKHDFHDLLTSGDLVGQQIKIIYTPLRRCHHERKNGPLL